MRSMITSADKSASFVFAPPPPPARAGADRMPSDRAARQAVPKRIRRRSAATRPQRRPQTLCSPIPFGVVNATLRGDRWQLELPVGDGVVTGPGNFASPTVGV